MRGQTALGWPNAVARTLLGLTLIGSGLLHFLATEAIAATVPPVLLAADLVTVASGLGLVVLGALLCVPGTTPPAALATVVAMLLFLPANIYVAAARPTIPDDPSWLPDLSGGWAWVRVAGQTVPLLWAVLLLPRCPPAPA